MDVSLRHWPIFVTGLLLGAAGTMSLGLHRPTQMELAAAQAAAQTVAAAPPAVVVSQVALDVGNQERVEEQMRVAADSFRAQEALAATTAAPQSIASAQPPKPRVRRVPKEVDVENEASSGPIANAQAFRPLSTRGRLLDHYNSLTLRNVCLLPNIV